MPSVPFLFPGQGAQSVGMGKDLHAARASVRALFQEASDALGSDLTRLCFDGPDTELVRTENVQPAITVVNLAVLAVLREEGVEPSAAAGHSLGEYAALCAAGAISFADTMRLVQYRGEVMRDAAAATPGGMTAIIGLDVGVLQAICTEVADVGSVEVANQNSPSQVALTGDVNALKRAAELAKARGAKLTIPLKVSGAWHSRFMAPARDAMRERLAAITIRVPAIPVISNVTAEPHPPDAETIREHLVQQVVRPVRWSDSMACLLRDGHRVLVECGPGKVLTGLLRDIDRAVTVHPVNDSASLAKALAALTPAPPVDRP